MKTNYTGYLFVHFIGEQKDGEQIYFSLSRDGIHWNDLNGGQVILRSEIGEAGARDPFIIRSPWEEKKYYLIIETLFYTLHAIHSYRIHYAKNHHYNLHGYIQVQS